MRAKDFACCLLLVAVATPVCAADSGVAVANIDKTLAGLRSRLPAATPAVTETYEYYEVLGDNEKDLRCQMIERGCTWEDGKKYDSVTRWSVKWSYDYDRAPNACAAEAFRAVVEVAYRYPKWVHSNNTLKSLADKWDSYMKSLVTHEQGHRDIAVQAATDLSRAVAALPPAPTCQAIDESVQTLCRDHMKKLNDDQKAYDAATVHGVKQGAVFP